MSKPYLKVTSDFTDDFNKIVKQFRGDDVLVGIPEATATRKTDEVPINNATILAINEFGSPASHIPPRPVMAIGIKNAQDAIADQFKLAFQSALKTGVAALTQYYDRAGLIASNSIKKAINAQDGIKGPADSTIAARIARGFKGTKALIVSGQMRNAITYVVKGKP